MGNRVFLDVWRKNLVKIKFWRRGRHECRKPRENRLQNRKGKIDFSNRLFSIALAALLLVRSTFAQHPESSYTIPLAELLLVRPTSRQLRRLAKTRRSFSHASRDILLCRLLN